MNKNNDVTVLTTDIRNFTYHSRKYERESENDFTKRFRELCDIVRNFYNVTLDCAKRHDIKKEAIVLTAGDGLIIGFQDEEHVITAYDTALALQKGYEQFFIEANGKMHEKRKSTALSYGIGIHTGKVVIEQYNSYHIPGVVNSIILGDALNISTRLEILTKDHTNCRILISEDTYNLLAEKLGDRLNGRFVDYQVHNIRGYRPLRLFGISDEQ